MSLTVTVLVPAATPVIVTTPSVIAAVAAAGVDETTVTASLIV